MKILAIDPGNTQSAYCMIEDYKPKEFGKIDNLELKALLHRRTAYEHVDNCIIEMVASYGMAVGREVFETCVWIGRFTEASCAPVEYIYRIEEKLAICHDSKARDSNIRQALIDRFAKHDFKTGKGVKKNPDFFYGFAKDVWSAFCVGTVWLDKHYGRLAYGQKSETQ